MRDHCDHHPFDHRRILAVGHAQRYAQRPLVALTIAVALITLVGTACSSKSSSDSVGQGEATTTTAGSTYELVSDEVVSAGLAEVRQMAAQVKVTLATDQAAAEALVTEMYDKWFAFEGTIRKNDKNLYLQMEDGLAAIKSGAQLNNMEKVDKGIADLEEGATGYLSAHP